MKLVAKIFLLGALILSVALVLSGYLMITASIRGSLQRETERALDRHQMVKFSVESALLMRAEPDAATAGRLEEILQGALDQSSEPAAIFNGEKKLLCANLPREDESPALQNASEDRQWHGVELQKNRAWLHVCGPVWQNNALYYLQTSTDISFITEQERDMRRVAGRVYFILIGASLLLMFLMSFLLTRPIRKMTRLTARIAGGHYGERLRARSRDEIGELSGSVNRMAEAIEDKIDKLSLNARQKEEFMAAFAHELKTPLTSVIGYADILYQEELPRDQAREAAGYIVSEGLRLEALSLKLLELIVLARRDFVLEETEIRAVVQNCAEIVNPMLAQKSITLQQNVAAGTLMLEADLFKTLVINLLDNAVKAGATEIKITGAASAGQYSLCVADNGKGIPAEEMPRITEAFYRADKSRARRQGGAGLGLALAAKIADIHGAALHFESKLNEGTRVIAALPLETPDKEAEI